MLALALALAASPEGQALARTLAASPAGLELALDLTSSPEVLDLALASSDEGRQLARTLANSNEGRQLALALADSPAGLELALDLTSSPEGRQLALDLISSTAGRELTRTLTSTNAGWDLALALATSPAGIALARNLINSNTGRNLARDLANSDEGQILAESLINSNTGRNLARDLATSPAGRNLARDLADSDTGRELISTRAGWFLARTMKRGDRRKPEVVASVFLLTVSAPALTLWLLFAGGVVPTLVFVAAVATRVDDESDEDDAPEEDGQEPPEQVDDPPSEDPVSVADVFELEHTARLDLGQADGVRARVEAFLGLVDRFLQDDMYPEHLQPRVDREVRALRDELYDNVDEPLGGVVQSYLGSLLQVTVPLLDPAELTSAAEEHGVDGEQLAGVVEAATRESSSIDDISPAVDIADHAGVLASDQESATPESRARWTAKVVGWVSTTGTAGVTSAALFGGAEKLVDLSFLSPEWGAVIGGCFGLAGAIAKIVTDETKPDPDTNDRSTTPKT